MIATLTLTADELIVALQALRDYQDRLDTRLRGRQNLAQQLLDMQIHASNVMTTLSEAYVNMDTPADPL